MVNTDCRRGIQQVTTFMSTSTHSKIYSLTAEDRAESPLAWQSVCIYSTKTLRGNNTWK